MLDPVSPWWWVAAAIVLAGIDMLIASAVLVWAALPLPQQDSPYFRVSDLVWTSFLLP